MTRKPKSTEKLLADFLRAVDAVLDYEPNQMYTDLVLIDKTNLDRLQKLRDEFTRAAEEDQ